MGQGGGSHSSDPGLRRCGWEWIIHSGNGDMNYSPVAYYTEYGTMDGRQTVPGSEMTAVMQARLAFEQYGQG
eukprot:888818-Karenia_brevis.AAC.1